MSNDDREMILWQAKHRLYDVRAALTALEADNHCRRVDESNEEFYARMMLSGALGLLRLGASVEDLTERFDALQFVIDTPDTTDGG